MRFRDGKFKGPFMRLVKAAAVFLAAALIACSPGGSNNPNGKPAAALTDPVVAATVNGKPIYIDDVITEAVARGAIKEGEDLPTTSPIFYQIMEDLIETRLMSNEAEARGLDKNSDVKHRLDGARERILANVLQENIAATALRESAIERMYREQVRLLKQGREVRARHILFDTREAALAAKKRLENGDLFEALAYELSKDRSTAPDGGDLGYFLPEAMPDAIREVCQTTPVGQVAGPVQSDDGWHLIKIEERRDASPPSMESMRPKIVQWLMFEEQRRIVERLKQNARIARITEQPGGVSAGKGMPAPDSAPTDVPEPPQDQPQAAAPPAAAPPAPAIKMPPAPADAPSAQAKKKPPVSGTLGTGAAPPPAPPPSGAPGAPVGSAPTGRDL
jgi:peptidyl-prolyl cis-trans isomerase C